MRDEDARRRREKGVLILKAEVMTPRVGDVWLLTDAAGEMMARFSRADARIDADKQHADARGDAIAKRQTRRC